MKKNVLLASAVLMSLGMAGNVHADEKVTSEKTNTVAVEAPKTATVEKKDAEKAPIEDGMKPAADTEDAELDEALDELNAELNEALDELDASIDELDEEIKAAEAKEHEEQIAEWTETLTNLFGTIEDLEVTDEFRADIFVQSFYFDVIDLKKEIQAYITENGSSEEAEALLDGLNGYLNEVGPVMKQLAALVDKYNAGQLTDEELLVAAEALFNAAEKSEKSAPKKESAPKAEVAPVEKKTETAPAPAEKKVEVAAPAEVKPVVTQEVAAPVETLPETGSDAKSFISVIGAALAGLTVWGFGFKKRG